MSAADPTWLGLPDEGCERREALFGGVGAVRVWELLPDQATDPFSAALACELDPAGSVGGHVQTTDVEIVVCIEGSGTATVDGLAHELCPGAVVYLPLGGRLALRNDARDAPLRYLIIKATARPSP